MPPTTLDAVEQHITNLLDSAVPSSKIILIEEHGDYPGHLSMEPLDETARTLFYDRYSGWMSRHLILNELHLANTFTAKLTRDGYYPVWMPSTGDIQDDIKRWSGPLRIEGYTLRPFQTFSLNRALERARAGSTNSERFWFWNWSAGAGKSFTSGAAAKALFDSGDIDLVIACTLSKLKENFRRTFENPAGLDAVVNDGTKAKRLKKYQEPHQVFVMNYEKLWHDEETISNIIAGRRVLWVLDEGHKLITESSKHNLARQALDRMVHMCTATVWPMSATVVGGNPLRYRDVFSLDGRPADNPLGTKADFISRYAREVREVPIKSRSGRRFSLITYDWDLASLQDIRHRVGGRTMAVRKTDPGVREQFKGIQTLPIPVQATEATQELLSVITERARAAHRRGESLASHYLLARIACINPEALRNSSSPEADLIVEEHPELIDAAHSAKIEILNGLLEDVREGQDKAVVFCHWTHQGLLPLARHITVPHVLHYGEQKAEDSQAAQDRFRSDPDLTAFCSSDAGTHGLNLQCARYVINVDPTYSYDDLAQRNARIDRADSHLDGLTAYVLITEGSVEERVWEVCESRRHLAAAVQGTQEELSYSTEEHSQRDENRNLEWLLFGEDQ